MEEVSEEKLKTILHSFQKDKIPGLDGWTIEFFLEAYETIGLDLLHLVEESWANGHVHSPLNTTFLIVIPKKDNPVILEYFRPISLYNITYKLIEKVFV